MATQPRQGIQKRDQRPRPEGPGSTCPRQITFPRYTSDFYVNFAPKGAGILMYPECLVKLD